MFNQRLKDGILGGEGKGSPYKIQYGYSSGKTLILLEIGKFYFFIITLKFAAHFTIEWSEVVLLLSLHQSLLVATFSLECPHQGPKPTGRISF